MWKKSLELFSDGLTKNVSNIVLPLLLSVVSLPVGVEMRSNCESFMSLQCAVSVSVSGSVSVSVSVSGARIGVTWQC